MVGRVTSVACGARHRFSKPVVLMIRLLAGQGVEGDAHRGETVRHRSRARVDPAQPNLRQVHLIEAELHEDLATAGFDVGAGDLGENITTRGLDLVSLPAGARLHIGATAVVEAMGLRNPCTQLDRFRPGLTAAVMVRDTANVGYFRRGLMAIVVVAGEIHPGDAIGVEYPAEPFKRLRLV